MKNKLLKILSYIIISLFFSLNLNSEELFNFNVSEIKITQDGNFSKVLVEVKLLQTMEFQSQLKILNITK